MVDYFIRVLPQLNHIFAPDVGNQSLNGAFSRLLSDPWQTALAVPDWVLTAADMLSLLMIITALVVLTLRRRCDEFVLSLIWLAGLTLIAGKNSFWNFAPCMFIGVYLIQRWLDLARWQKWCFIASALISNLFWYPIYLAGFNLVPADLPIPRVLFVLIFSAGAASLFLEVAVLLGMRSIPVAADRTAPQNIVTGAPSRVAARTQT